MANTTEPRLNIKRILKHLGGQTAISRLLKKQGVICSPKTVEMWGFRNSIPANRLASLIKLAGVIGKPLDLDSFSEPA